MAAKRDLYAAARALQAFQRGEDSTRATVGAMLWADVHDTIRAFAKAYLKFR